MSKLYTESAMRSLGQTLYALGLRDRSRTRVPNVDEVDAIMTAYLDRLALPQDRQRTYQIRKGRFRS